MNALIDLAARCEAATGPDRELDDDISFALASAGERVPAGHIFNIGTQKRTGIKAREYTASLDAAIMLVPEPGKLVSIHLDYDDEQKRWFCELDGFDVGDAATRALALCAAALRARAEKSSLDITEDR